MAVTRQHAWNYLNLKEGDIGMDKEFNRLYGAKVEGTYNAVDNPRHYCSGEHECIDVMEHMFGTHAVIDFCKCNIFKYRFRATQKNGEEDIKKAEWYENKLMELNEKLYDRQYEDMPKPIYNY